MALTLADLVATHADPVVTAATPPATPAPAFRTGATDAPAAAAKPVTAPQITYLKKLFAERTGNADAMTLRDGLLAAYKAGGLTSKVASATIKMLTEDDNFKPAKVAAPVAETTATEAPVKVRGGAWAGVPDGRYAVHSATGTNDLDFYLVSTSDEEGDWFGFRRVERVIGGNADAAVKGTARRAALEAIEAATYEVEARTITLDDGSTGVIPARSASGPEAAGLRYADEIGRCVRCNRHLTDLTSRINGIGPVCITK